ncbi:serine/threonine-protein kinase [Agromyces ramosus]|uniref:non-specific serine/threonine protein kinase n=1 Tax=Agromyces ramosus TaxID=33879 RepID=A0ABU0R6Y0_9MICO|nr:serine/threonine-protein kinase [Agromyces ramosus]MDQ0893841.1 serine/threonine protein kinase [Agromyces ramosus]
MTTYPHRVAGDPFAGTTLDARYRLDSLIGRGGMATVYRGEDLTLGRQVAVKVFAEAAEGIDDLERRRSETALLASLSHRALVRLYDASRDKRTGREYLVMELIDGTDLRQALRTGPLGAADAADLLADVGEALHVIHARGIVHRDVKPANVLLEPAHLPTRSWNAKLADFGIARLIDDARLTRTGLLVGTPGYLSPEQVSGKPTGGAADVYALGLLVLEARTGQTAFPGASVEAAAARLVRDPDIPASLGDDWCELLRAMTAREPEARPTALDVALAASRLDTSSGSTAPDDSRRLAETVAVDSGAAGTATTVPDRGHDREREPIGATAATKVLPDQNQAARAVAAALQPAPRASRRWVRPAIAATLLAAIAVVAALVLPGAIAGLGTAPEPSLTPLPSVPGELGVHLEELDEAVTE